MIIQLNPRPQSQSGGATQPLAKQPVSAQKKRALARFHTACSAMGLTDDAKAAVLASYGAQSSGDLTVTQLHEAAGKIQPKINDAAGQARNRLMAAIGGWLRLQDKEENATYIKAIALQAAGMQGEIIGGRNKSAAINKMFNEIPLERLHAIYNDFLKKQKALRK